jgi:hypothetical protein
VYHCTRCFDDIAGYGGVGYYSCGFWGFCNLNGGNSWNFYDPALALYRMYLRTGNADYLTKFRVFTDAWWTWAIGMGGKGDTGAGGPPRANSLVSQFIRALDGQPQRLPVLYYMLNLDWYFNVYSYPNGEDNREPGYQLLYNAVGARADSDPTRHAQYCVQVSSLSQAWLDVQAADGSWPEKNGPYPYDAGGMSPWRSFATLQGLARAYESLNDTSSVGCNDTGKAAAVLTAIQKGAAFVYTRGMSGTDPTGIAYSRAVHYDVNYQAEGQIGVGNPKNGSCTVTVGSAEIHCTGTRLLKDFACNGTDFIGITDQYGGAWTHRVASCASDTEATLADNWGTQCLKSTQGAAGTYKIATSCEGSFTSTGQIYEAPAASTDCHSAATTCRHLPGRSGNYDLIWIMGWLYKTTGAEIWRTRGDELFSAAYGGPADGTGGKLACTGPACDGFDTQLGSNLNGCGTDPPPCASSNYGLPHTEMNTYVFQGKTLGQAAGIGGADNYLAWRLTIAVPPTAPTGASATAGNARVSLSWDLVSGATSYNIYRGTSAGAEDGSPLATGVTTNTYLDTGVINGTAYYYEISAVNAIGESGLSSEVSATPAGKPGNVRPRLN